MSLVTEYSGIMPAQHPDIAPTAHPRLEAQLREAGLTPTALPAAVRRLLEQVDATYHTYEAQGADGSNSNHTPEDEAHAYSAVPNYRVLFENAYDAIIIFDPNGERVLEANDRACEMYGYTRDEFIGLSLTTLSQNPLEGIKRVRQTLDAASRGEYQSIQFETTHFRKDHSTLRLEINGNVVDYQGQTAILSVNRDITDRKRTERALHESERRFAQIFHLSPSATLVMTPLGLILDVNESFERLVGYTRDELVGHSLEERNLYVGNTAHILGELLRLNQMTNYEVRLRTKSGALRDTLNAVEWIELDGELCLLAQYNDITERKAAEAEVRQSEARYRTLAVAEQRQAQELRLLNEVRSALAQQIALKEVIALVVEAIAATYGYTMVSVYLVEGEFLLLQHQVGYEQVISRLSLRHGVMGRVARTAQPILLTDVKGDLDFVEAVSGITSEICVPLLDGEQVVGVLNLETRGDSLLNEADFQLVMALSDHITIAIQRASLFTRLTDSNERYERVINATNEVIFQVDKHGRWSFLNPAWTQITGYSVAATLDKSIFDVIFIDDLKLVRQEIVRALRQNVPDLHVSCRIRSANGTLRWVEARMRLLYDDEGQYIGATGLITDITDWREAEQREEEQRALAETLQATAAALTSTLDFNEIVNHLKHDLTRVMPHFDAIRVILLVDDQMEMTSYVTEVDSDQTTQALAWSFERDAVPSVRDMLKTGEGFILYDASSDMFEDFSVPEALRWIRSSVSAPIRSKDGVVGMLNLDSAQPNQFTFDHSERLKAFADLAGTALRNAQLYATTRNHAAELERRVAERTAELRDAKEQVESILNTSGDAIILLNDEGIIRKTNPAFERLLGISERQAVSNAVFVFVEPTAVSRLAEALADATTTQQAQRLELPIRRRDGVQFDADMLIDPMLVSAAGARGAVVSLRDISERRKMEDDLRQALDKERRLVELKSRFSAMVSHEFRTPLATIQTSADLVKSFGSRLTEERKQTVLTTIGAQVKHLTAMLDDMLAISKADTVGADFNPVPTDLVPFCEGIASEIQWLAGATHQVQFRATEAASCAAVPIDQALLRRALVNLLGNAVKYSPEGGLVEFTLGCAPTDVMMQIRDSGIGIPASDLAQLFETFHRASNVGLIPGTGLGLAIVKRSVDAHGGTIDVQSQVGQGTTFTITLPIR